MPLFGRKTNMKANSLKTNNHSGIGAGVRKLGGILGAMFGGNRDVYKVFGYNKGPSYQNMFDKYTRQDIAGRIVDAEPNTTWAQPPEIEADDAFNKAWEKLSREHALFSTITDLDKLLAMGRYAVLVIGFDDGADLTKPANTGTEKKVIYFKAYSEVAAKIQAYNDEPTSPNYGKPEMYQVDPTLFSQGTRNTSGQMSSFNPKPFNVHASRVVHVAEHTLESTVFGIPRMLRIYNLLDDLLKISGGSAETFWLTSNRGMQIDVDKELDLKKEDAAGLDEELEDYENNLSRVIRTRGVKINSLGSDVADPSAAFDVILSLLSAATGIPRRILVGSEVAQLASAQDRANWANHIERRRFLFAEPMILTPLIRKLIDAKALPELEDIIYKWPEAFIQNPLEMAQTIAQNARGVASIAKAQFDNPWMISPEEARGVVGLEGPAPKMPKRENLPGETPEGMEESPRDPNDNENDNNDGRENTPTPVDQGGSNSDS